MRWEIRGRRQVYGSEWVEVWVEDVQPPGGDLFEHHVVRMPKSTVGAVVVDEDHVLLLWRHRFITDSWGWEIPAGWVDPDEDLHTAALREVEEETGWRAATAELLVTYNTLSGISDVRMNLFLARDVTHTGPVADTTEATRVEWLPVDRIADMARKGEIADGVSLTALTYFLAVHRG